jgi:putative endonuclease
MTRAAAGAQGEHAALAHLQHAGLRLVARNFSCRLGELDLVMLDDQTLVFIEVRYRRGAAYRSGFGDGMESISAAKRAKLAKAAAIFLSLHPAHARRACRFDVVALAGDAPALTLDWRQNAFDVP